LAKRNIDARKQYSQEGYDEKQLLEQERGPRVMVIGPANSGKSTMVKGLLNLAVGSGMGWSPGVVGLDSGTVSASTYNGSRQETDDDLSAIPSQTTWFPAPSLSQHQPRLSRHIIQAILSVLLPQQRRP
jgi:ATPase subunit of ABC transporter with duplicated ATPase domains